MRTTYTTKNLPTGKVAVLRVTSYYPKGTLVHKFANEASAQAHIARQLAEDLAYRAKRVNEYLAERAARPTPAAAEATTQLNLF